MNMRLAILIRSLSFILVLCGSNITAYANGSLSLLGVGNGPGCPEATAFLARNGNANASATTTLICGLVSDGVYTGFDVLYIFATDTAAHGVLNVVSGAGTFDATRVNSPTFTPNVGFTFNGVNQYLNTNFHPATDAVQYSLNSASIGICVQTNNTAPTADIGVSDGISAALLGANYTGIGTLYVANEGVNSSAATASSDGTWAVNRSTINIKSLYHGASATPYATTSVASVAVPTIYSFFIGGYSYQGGLSAPSNRQYSFAWIGRSFTGAEYLKIETRGAAYMLAIGQSGC